MNKINFVGIVAVWLLSFCTAALSDYKLQPGDAVQLSVAGSPDLLSKVTIDADGEVSFPVISRTRIADLSLHEAEEAIRRKFESQLLQRRTPDGRDVAMAIPANTVSLTVAEYRPIYVTGDVSKPGEQVFRPGMTVRRAIAVAGGLDLIRIRMDNPFLEAADFAGEYQSLWAEQARLTARKWQLEAEVAGKAATSAPTLPSAVSEALRNRVAEIARQAISASLSSSEAQKSHLADIVQKSDAQLKLLKSRLGSDEEGAEADSVDYKRLQDLAKRGSILQNRLSESRRLLLLSTTQALQTRIQIAQVERERAKASRDIERVDEDLRRHALEELGKTEADLAKVESRIATVAEKLTYAGLVRSQLVGAGDHRPRVVLYRQGKEAGEDVGEDTALAPGDTIEVALQVPRESGTASARVSQ